MKIVPHPEVTDALAQGAPVVAMESTIYSTLGLPRPDNAEAVRRCVGAVRAEGAVPAITAVIDGVVRLGLDDEAMDRVLNQQARKMASRDIGVAVAQRWPVGASTVSASLAIAAACGVAVFATGGIGGVHRGSEQTGDVSADLAEIAAHPVVTVCAGAKAFLDLARTLEWLETAGVPVLGWKTDDFPAFYTRSSGLAVPHRVDNAETVAAVLHNRARSETGVLVAAPVPAEAELDPSHMEETLSAALADAERTGITGAPITPFILGRIAEVTQGLSIPCNLALAEHNASVAARIAVAMSRSH